MLTQGRGTANEDVLGMKIKTIVLGIGVGMRRLLKALNVSTILKLILKLKDLGFQVSVRIQKNEKEKRKTFSLLCGTSSFGREG